MRAALVLYASAVAAAVVVRDPTPTAQRRALTDIPASVTKAIGSAIPSDAAGGILPGWLKIPTDDEIKKQLGLNDTTISSLPIQVRTRFCIRRGDEANFGAACCTDHELSVSLFSPLERARPHLSTHD